MVSTAVSTDSFSKLQFDERATGREPYAVRVSGNFGARHRGRDAGVVDGGDEMEADTNR